ncbi:AI-2E family transporter [Dactylococcopsis salina]|uniref:Permease n=1 Tax=Dactylococcopsis salina (strain PCC 8305) TaxID=13035 RepID=K9YWP4_DACS8|nr:putative permease [Dactylococcopsis salina PCC 8305]
MRKPDRSHFWSFFSNYYLIRYLLLFTFGWATIQILAYFQTIILIFVFASILAFLLNYPVQWFKQYLPHSTAVVIVFLSSLILFIFLFLTLGLIVISEFQTFLSKAPNLIQSLLTIFEETESWLEQFNLSIDLQFLQQEFQSKLGSTINFSTIFLRNTLTRFVELIIILVIAFFMLLDGQTIWRNCVKVFPQSYRVKITTSLRDNFLGFFRGRLLLSLFFGVSAFLVYLILQTPYPWLLAVIVGVFDLIPGIGATIGISVAALIVLPQGIGLSLKVIIFCVLLQQIEENILMPRIMQSSVNLNPVLIFFALLIGVRIAGFLGLFLAIPTTAVIVSCLQNNKK